MLSTIFLRAELLEGITEFRSDRAEGCYFVHLGDQFKLHLFEEYYWKVAQSECLRILA